MTLFDHAERFVTRIAALSAVLGGLGLIAATILTCLSILLRLTRRVLDAVFGGWFDIVPWAGVRPILGEEELVAHAVGLALFAALPWAMIQKGHIRIDLFERWFGDRLNAVLDLIGDLALAMLAYLILTRQWFLIFTPARRSEDPMLSALLAGDAGVIADRLRDAPVSQVLGFPLWPAFVVAEACIALFLLAAVFCVWRSGRAVMQSGQG